MFFSFNNFTLKTKAQNLVTTLINLGLIKAFFSQLEIAHNLYTKLYRLDCYLWDFSCLKLKFNALICHQRKLVFVN